MHIYMYRTTLPIQKYIALTPNCQKLMQMYYRCIDTFGQVLSRCQILNVLENFLLEVWGAY